MRVGVVMAGKDELVVERWETKEPGAAVKALRDQLALAAAVWPELENYAIGKKQP
jgi:hypothetical protein